MGNFRESAFRCAFFAVSERFRESIVAGLSFFRMYGNSVFTAFDLKFGFVPARALLGG
jgi:hypothetical protein